MAQDATQELAQTLGMFAAAKGRSNLDGCVAAAAGVNRRSTDPGTRAMSMGPPVLQPKGWAEPPVHPATAAWLPPLQVG